MKKLFFKKINKACPAKPWRSGGYTIIETMIAVSLFLIVVTIGMGSLLNANKLYNKAQNMRSILDSLNFTMEDMSRNLRIGAYYYCIPSGNPPLGVGLGYTQDNSGCGGISFESGYDGSQWVYYRGNNPNISGYYSIFRTINGVTTQLTPDEINITSGSIFTVVGANPPLGNTKQPFVTIKLVGNITYNGVDSPFSLQTSVSQRKLDI